MKLNTKRTTGIGERAKKNFQMDLLHSVMVSNSNEKEALKSPSSNDQINAEIIPVSKLVPLI
jgi:hypothetical protein